MAIKLPDNQFHLFLAAPNQKYRSSPAKRPILAAILCRMSSLPKLSKSPPRDSHEALACNHESWSVGELT